MRSRNCRRALALWMVVVRLASPGARDSGRARRGGGRSRIILHLLAPEERHDGERGAVRLVVVPHRVVPPRTVLFLVRDHVRRELARIIGAAAGTETLDQFGGVVVVVIVVVAPCLIPGLVRPRAFP